MRTVGSVCEDLTRAGSSMNVVQEALAEFQAACIVHDEPASKVARERALGALDSFMDNIAAAHQATGA